MARFHRATITPTKEELLADRLGEPVEAIGSYRFDDPDGRVGMETFLVHAGGVLHQVPLTYRDQPLADAPNGALLAEMEHSVLGTRWVYDGVRDPRYVVMLAAVTMTGQGEALGMAVYDGRWYVAPSAVRIQGGGWSQDRVPVDGFSLTSEDPDAWVLRNDGFELTVHRRPSAVATRPPMALVATWDGQADPVLLAEIVRRP